MRSLRSVHDLLSAPASPNRPEPSGNFSRQFFLVYVDAYYIICKNIILYHKTYTLNRSLVRRTVLLSVLPSCRLSYFPLFRPTVLYFLPLSRPSYRPTVLSFVLLSSCPSYCLVVHDSTLSSVLPFSRLSCRPLVRHTVLLSVIPSYHPLIRIYVLSSVLPPSYPSYQPIIRITVL